MSNIPNQIVLGPDSKGIVTEIIHRINEDGLREKVTRKYTSSDPHGCAFRLRRKHKIIKPFGTNSNSKNFKSDATSISPEEVFIEAPNAKKEDIVLIAGKGHEDYQILNDKIIDFDDRKIAYKFLEEKIKSK